MAVTAPEVENVRLAPFDGGQTLYMESPEYEVLFGGETGPGKTAMLVLDAAGIQFQYSQLGKRAIDVESYRAVLFRLKTTQLAKLKDEGDKFFLPLGAEFVYGRHGDPGASYNFKSGARIFLCHLEDIKNVYDHDGQEYQYIGYDELTQFTIFKYLYPQSRLRSKVPHLFTRVRATAMPVGSGLWWVKKRFSVDEPYTVRYFTAGDENPELNPRGEEVDASHPDARGRVFIPGYLDENRVVNKGEYRSNVKLLGKAFERAMLHHDWNAFSGDFFPEFDLDKEHIEPHEIPKEWELICSIDPGWSGICSAGLLARDFNGAIYRIATYYERNRNNQMNAKGVKAFWQHNKFTHGRMPSYFVAGRDAFAHKDRNAVIQSEATFADAFRAEGMNLLPAVTDRTNGWGTMRSLMPDRFFVFKYFNTPFIDELVSLSHDDKNPNDIKGGGNDPDVKDHAVDDNRYGVMSIFQPEKRPEETRPSWFVQEVEKDRSSSGWSLGDPD